REVLGLRRSFLGGGLIPTKPSSVHRFSVGIHNRRCSTMEFFKLADFLSHLGWVVFENFEFTTRALNSDSKRRFHFIPPSQLRTSPFQPLCHLSSRYPNRRSSI